MNDLKIGWLLPAYLGWFTFKFRSQGIFPLLRHDLGAGAILLQELCGEQCDSIPTKVFMVVDIKVDCFEPKPTLPFLTLPEIRSQCSDSYGSRQVQ